MARRVSLLVVLGSSLIFAEFGVWIVRDMITTPEKIDRIVETIKEIGVDRIYVQIVGRMDAFYKSDILPKSEMIEDENFYPFEYLLEKLKGSDVKVSAWMNVFYAWPFKGRPKSPKHVVNAHPDWVTYDERGYSALEYSKAPTVLVPGIFLDPGLDEVKEYVTKIAEEIAEKFDIDEIHLDYIRYPYRTFGYNPTVMKRYRKWVRKAMREGRIKDMSKAFDDFRRDQITKTVEMIKRVVEKHGKKLSAAVYAYYDEAYNDVFQDWITWLKKGYLDYAVMMAYDPSVETVMSYVDFAKERLGNLKRIRVGIGLYKMHDKPDLLLKMLETVGKENPDEIVLFSYKFINDDVIKILRDFSSR